MLIRETHHNAISVLQPNCRCLSGTALDPLHRMVEAQIDSGASAVLIDVSQVGHMSRAGLATLTELTSRWHANRAAARGHTEFGLCGLTARDRADIQALGLDTLLPIYPTAAAALSAPRFRRCALTGTRAVILPPRHATRLSPLTMDIPFGMLDILGKPLIERVMDQLTRHGLRDVTLVPGTGGTAIPQHFKARRDLALFFAHDPNLPDPGAAQHPASSADTLLRLHRNHSSFLDDTFVIECDSLCDVDLAAMMQMHKTTGAAVTLAGHVGPLPLRPQHGVVALGQGGRAREVSAGGPGPAAAGGGLAANTGIYVLSAAALDAIGGARQMDFALQVLPRLIARGLPVQVFATRVAWSPITTARGYFDVCSAALTGDLPHCRPSGMQVSDRCWQHPTAIVPAATALDGPTYLGPGVTIERGAELRGVNVIGGRSRVAARSFLRNAMIWPGTRVKDGAIVDTMIASGAWAVNHRFADGTPRNRSPLDHLGPVDAVQPFETARDIRIA